MHTNMMRLGMRGLAIAALAWALAGVAVQVTRGALADCYSYSRLESPVEIADTPSAAVQAVADQALLDARTLPPDERVHFEAIATAGRSPLEERGTTDAQRLTSADVLGPLGVFDVEKVDGGWAVTMMAVRIAPDQCQAR